MGNVRIREAEDMVVARASWMMLAGAFARLFTEGMAGVRVYFAVVALDAEAWVATVLSSSE